MRFFYILFILVLLVFSASCAKQPKEVLIDSFEGEINSNTVDFGSSENSSLKVAAERNLKVCGEQSLKLDYDLKASGYMWAARGWGLDVKTANKWLISPEDINWRKYNAISLYMYGTNSGAVVAFDFKDAKGEVWRFLLDDDFQGWKEITCPFLEFFPRSDWQPETATRDEILDFPIRSFQFEPRSAGKNIYYFDCVKLVRVKR